MREDRASIIAAVKDFPIAGKVLLVLIFLCIGATCFLAYRMDRKIIRSQERIAQLEMEIASVEATHALTVSKDVSEKDKEIVALRKEIAVEKDRRADMLQRSSERAARADLTRERAASLSKQLTHERQQRIAAQKRAAFLQALLRQQFENSLVDIKKRIAKAKDANEAMRQRVKSVAKEFTEVEKQLLRSLHRSSQSQ